MANGTFHHLLQPIEIGPLLIRNRVMMPAMATCYATSDCQVTEQMIGYYARRAEGGVGLIIIEAVCIDNPGGRAIPHQLCIDQDRYMEGLSRLAEAVRSRGAKVALQLHHAGPNTHLEGAHPVAPSPVPMLHRPNAIPRELSRGEIKEIVRKFALGAGRAKRSGFDAVELLCAHGYLLNRFLSPHANRRQDEYGRGREGRAKILEEILAGIRREAGNDFPILCKLPGDDYVEGGIDIEESIALANMLKELGVNGLTITGGSSEAKFIHIGPMEYPPAWQVHLADRVKQKVKIPIAAISKINRPELAEKILGENQADMVALGRALIADPAFVRKAEKNEAERIIPCLGCNHCLDRIVDEGKALRCSVNPLTGREYDLRVVPAGRSRKILVAGGGPAGMEAAAVLASRGHRVVLMEKNEKLGGQLLLASAPPGKEEIRNFTDYLSRELEKNGVEVHLNAKVTGRVIEERKPEVLICATGAVPLTPSIPGRDRENVFSSWDALRNLDQATGQVVVIGGGMVGCEVASFLAEKGRKVILVEQLEEVGLDIGPSLRKFEMARLQNAAVTVLTRTEACEITREGVVIQSPGEKKLLPADTVVLAMGSCPDTELLQEMRAAGIEVYAVGDCIAPRKIVQATSQGFYVGLSV